MGSFNLTQRAEQPPTNTGRRKRSSRTAPLSRAGALLGHWQSNTVPGDGEPIKQIVEIDAFVGSTGAIGRPPHPAGTK